MQNELYVPCNTVTVAFTSEQLHCTLSSITMLQKIMSTTQMVKEKILIKLRNAMCASFNCFQLKLFSFVIT